MNDQHINSVWPEDENTELDSLLTNLGRLKPSEGFADRVMARVAVPHAAVATSPSRGIRISRRLGWALFGGYSVASAASLVAIVVLMNSGAFGVGALSAGAGAALTSLAIGFATAVSSLAPTPSQIIAILPALVGAAVAMWLIALVSAVGLYRIMKSYSRGRVSAHAAR